ncbi:MAG: di-heme oxidoredictase family protein, partial [Verrucomicrobiota bacterium]
MKCRILPALCLAATAPAAEKGPAWSGGDGTVFNEGHDAFSLPLAHLSRERRREFVVGNAFFNENWVAAPASTEARDGLGPLFHARSCSGCHTRVGCGSPRYVNDLLMCGLVLSVL